VIRWPESVIAIKSHVVFSEDGALYESAAQQHSSRRGQCRMWHNGTWLARMLAAMAFLEKGFETPFFAELREHPWQ